MAGQYIKYSANGSGGGGSGTVTSVSVVSANGLAGSVANPTTTPAITLSTSITGLLQGNGTAISAATTGNLTESTSSVLTITGGTGSVLGSGTSIQVKLAGAAQSGYLSSTDWNTFNNKQSTITIGSLDAQAANANGLALVSNVLSTQSADATHPGMINTTTQTLAGAKTFSSDLSVSSSSTTAFVINSTSFVFDATNNSLGIGMAPGANTVLDLLAQSSATTQNLQLTNYDNAGNAGLKIRRARGTSGSPTAVQSNDSLGFCGGLGYGATAFGSNVKASISFIAGENWTDSAQGAYLTLNSTATGSTTRTERVRVTTSGRVLINTTTDDGTNQLQVNGNIVGSNLSGTNTGDVTLAAVGASPNANGASLSGQVLTLQPASGTQPGLMTAGSQTIGGAKTFSSTISASNLSGTNTGDQTITLTGDVTGSGTGSFAATIANLAVTNAKIANTTIDLTAKVTGVLPIANGGTNNGSLAVSAGGVLYTDGSKVVNVGVGTSGQLLQSNGSSAPSWVTSSNGFQFFVSSQVSSNSSAITSGTFTTFDNSPAFSVACTVTGKYKVYASAPFYLPASATEAITRITNTSGGASLVAESQATINASSSSVVTTSVVQSVYTLTSGNTYVFDIQGKVLSGTSVELFAADGPFYMFAELCG